MQLMFRSKILLGLRYKKDSKYCSSCEHHFHSYKIKVVVCSICSVNTHKDNEKNGAGATFAFLG